MLQLATRMSSERWDGNHCAEQETIFALEKNVAITSAQTFFHSENGGKNWWCQWWNSPL
jgi:hypothetical protein